MNIKLIVVGKTNQSYVEEGVKEYFSRLKHYISFEIIVVPDVKGAKNLSSYNLKDKEAENIIKYLNNQDTVVLLDEHGQEFRSKEFAQYLQKKMNQGTKTLVFVVGGAFGFSDKMYSLTSEKISISKMTFSHQMIRLLFTEQLYRAFTILHNEPYHNE
jgi:23S rRNA (pseudouridine1915-N3)-methyltransferase